jgi:hypothetical protein
MKRMMVMALAASATLGLSAPDLHGQGRGNGAGQARAGQAQAAQQQARGQAAQQQREAERARMRAEREREAERERLRNQRDSRADIDWNRRDQQARGGSPAFCRSGSGHPVHGRQWCRDKGFGLGSERWERAGWEDVIFGQPRDRRRYDQGAIMNRGTLADVLGDVVLRRFEGYGQQRGGGPITGQWLSGVDGRILQLSIGGAPFAQLMDSRNRGRADTILLRR